jgi:tRNA A-37 threonylcarbamoyl transferase component Bud32
MADQIDKNIINMVSKCNFDTIKQCILDDKVKRTSTEDTCKWKKEKGESVGRGQSGEAYSVCCGKNCDYIIKVIKFDTKNTKDRFIQEVKMQHAFYKIDFAPRILVACYCDHEGVILMEKVRMLSDYIKNEKNRLDDYKIKNMYVEKYSEALDKGLFHNDTNEGNIAISLYGTKPMMIDFGSAFNSKDNPKKAKELNKEDALPDFKMSLDAVFLGKKAIIKEPTIHRTKSRIPTKSHFQKNKKLFDSDDDEDEFPLFEDEKSYSSSDDETLSNKKQKKKMFRVDDDEDDFSSSDDEIGSNKKKKLFDSDDDEDEFPLFKD